MKASSLNSNDVFVIVTPDGVHMWCGKGSTGDEREMAKIVANKESKADFFIVSEGLRNDFLLHRQNSALIDRTHLDGISILEPDDFSKSKISWNFLLFVNNDIIDCYSKW